MDGKLILCVIFFKYYAYMYRHIMVGVDAIIVSLKCLVESHGNVSIWIDKRGYKCSKIYLCN